MSTIYLAMATWDYEGAEPIKAFPTRPDADAFVARCAAYHRTREPYPEDDDDDDAFEAYQKAYDAWRLAHPASPHATCDGFSVTEIELVGAVSENDPKEK